MDSIDWSEIHHFETALYSPLFKGIKQKKRYPYPNFDVTLDVAHRHYTSIARRGKLIYPNQSLDEWSLPYPALLPELYC